MIALAVAILAVFAGNLFDNSRISDVNRHIDDKFALLSQHMRHMEDNIMRMLGDHDTRLGDHQTRISDHETRLGTLEKRP